MNRRNGHIRKRAKFRPVPIKSAGLWGGRTRTRTSRLIQKAQIKGLRRGGVGTLGERGLWVSSPR